MQSCRKATTRTSGCSTESSHRLDGLRGGVGLLLAGCFVAAAASLAATSLLRQATAEQQAAPVKPDDVAAFMRQKLDHSQDVLAGLALEDFEMIGRGAQKLALASQASSWQVLQTEDYARQSAEFRRSCDALNGAAKSRNLDGAALAWMEVTQKCVQCHRYIRDEKR